MLHAAGKVLATDERERVAVAVEPVDGFKDEEVEEGRADEGGRGAGEGRGVGATSVGDVFARIQRVDAHKGVAGGAAVIEGVVGDGVQILAAGVHGRGDAAHGDAGEGDDGEAFFAGVEGDLDGGGVFAGVGNDDDDLAGVEAVGAVVALGEAGAVADDVFRKAHAGVEEAGDGHEAAGAADELAADDLAVAAAEGVKHAAGGEGIGDEAAGGLEGGLVKLAGFGEEIGGGGVVSFGEGGHGDATGGMTKGAGRLKDQISHLVRPGQNSRAAATKGGNGRAGSNYRPL